MNSTPKAEEVADKIWARWHDLPKIGPEAFKKEIAETLTQFEEARVKEAIDDLALCVGKDPISQKIRDEALEEDRLQCIAHHRASYCPRCRSGWDNGLEEAAKISEKIAERELEISRDYKGHMVFQSQSYIDAAVEIEESIRALKSKEKP